jgi:hypothetical protein
MRKIYTLFLSFCLFATSGMAQFRFSDSQSIGQKVLTDELNGVPTGNKTLWGNFNSNVRSAVFTTTTFTKPNCQTSRGLQIKTFLQQSLDSTATIDGSFDCNNYGSARNAGHFASLDSMKHWLKAAYAITAASTAPADTQKYAVRKPIACLFDKTPGDSTDLVYGSYPGVYKRVEYGFYWDMTGNALASDLTFDMYTYDAGNTGKTAVYNLIVYAGGTTDAYKMGTVENIYTTGDPMKTVEVFKAIGLDYTKFSNKKIYVFVKTIGTATATSANLMDPIVVFDNLRISYGTAKWVSPAAVGNTEYNKDGTGIYTPYTLNGTVATGHLRLKGENRLAALTIFNNAMAKGSDNVYEFLPANGVFANDGAGNYTVPVTYKYTADTINPTSGNLTQPYITIPAPTNGSINDDIEVLFTFTPKQSTGVVERLEISNGIRFWWDVQTASLDLWASLNSETNQQSNVWSSDGKVFVKGAQTSVTLFNILGQRLGSFRSDVAEHGISVGKGLLFVSTSNGVVKVMVK